MIITLRDRATAAVDAAAIVAPLGAWPYSLTTLTLTIGNSDSMTAAQRAAVEAAAQSRAAFVSATASPPRTYAHGASSLYGWDPETAIPRLHRIDTVGSLGFLALEAWYRVEDVDTSGLMDAPVAGAVPVVAHEYPAWVYGTFASGMSGIQSRARDRVWYAEDGTEYARISDPTPKPYSIGPSAAAGQARRRNVAQGTDRVPSRLAQIGLKALSIAQPGTDPGPALEALRAGLADEIAAYVETGEKLSAELAKNATLTAHPWLGTDIGGGVTAQAAMVAECAEPGAGTHNPLA